MIVENEYTESYQTDLSLSDHIILINLLTMNSDNLNDSEILAIFEDSTIDFEKKINVYPKIENLNEGGYCLEIFISEYLILLSETIINQCLVNRGYRIINLLKKKQGEKID